MVTRTRQNTALSAHRFSSFPCLVKLSNLTLSFCLS